MNLLLVIVQPSVIVKSVALSLRIRNFRSFLRNNGSFDSFNIQILEQVLQKNRLKLGDFCQNFDSILEDLLALLDQLCRRIVILRYHITRLKD